MPAVYREENNQYELDCTAAVWSTDGIHNCYQNSLQHYGKINFLCDVDFVIENETNILLVEYKNANIPGAAHPERFNPIGGDKLKNVAHKFFDSLHWLYLVGKDKPRKYIYILEYPNGNSVSRLLVRNELKERLPFKMQASLSGSQRKLIDEIRVVDIAEWNADAELGRYPIRPVNLAP